MKKIFIKLSIFFLPALLAVFIFSFNLPAAHAAQGECHLENCLVPSPTILLPKINSINSSGQINLVGLTWKRTVVKVYLDGQELIGVKQYDHEDYFAGFYLTANVHLKPGKHYLYTIAHSEKPGWFDQSKESAYIYFTVPVPKPQPIAVINDLPVESDLSQVAEPSIDNGLNVLASTSLTTVEVNQGQIEGGVFVEAEEPGQVADASNDSGSKDQDQAVQQTLPSQGPSASNLTDLQNAGQVDDLSAYLENEFLAEQVKATAKRNRLIGLVVLAVLVLGFLISRLVGKKSVSHAGQFESAVIAPSTLATGQQPQEAVSVEAPATGLDQLKSEAIARAEHVDYWVPGPTPYTPYSLNDEFELDSLKEKNKEFDK